MSQSAQAVLAAFDELAPAEREQVVSELLKRVALSEHGAVSDEEMVAAADQVFLALDRRENSER